MSIINDWRAPAFWLQRRGGPIDLRCFCGPGRSIVRKRFARDRRQGALRAGGTKRQRKIVGSYVLATRLSELQEKLECGTECIMKRKAGSVGDEPITRRMLWSWMRSGEGRTFAHDGTETDRSCAGTTLRRRTLRPQAGEVRWEHVEDSEGNDELLGGGGGCRARQLEARVRLCGRGRIRRGRGDSGEAMAGQVESAEPHLRKYVNQAGGRNIPGLIAGRGLAAGAAIRDPGSKGPHMDG